METQSDKPMDLWTAYVESTDRVGMLLRTTLVLVASLVLITGCEDKPTSPPKPRPWEIKPDSMNLGILILDYLTYEFEGGRVDHFVPCDTCDRDSLPFEQIYNPPRWIL